MSYEPVDSWGSPGEWIRYFTEAWEIPFEKAEKIVFMGSGVVDRFVVAWLICRPDGREKLVNLFANLPKEDRQRLEREAFERSHAEALRLSDERGPW